MIDTRHRALWSAVFAALFGAASAAAAGTDNARAIVRREFVFSTAPSHSSHASTLAETADGLVAAWYGGPHEGHVEVGIWLSRYSGGSWSPPVEVADGRQPMQRRFAAWNPVLFQVPGGPLLLFYKVGPNPAFWWGMLATSADGGRSWTTARRLPDGFIGPSKNKPLLLADGTLLCPSSLEQNGWWVRMERTTDLGRTWAKSAPLNDAGALAAIQPTILQHAGGALQMLCRSTGGRIAESWSNDGGVTWSPMRLTALPNPDAGIDAVVLADGRSLLVYNPTTNGRTPLAVALSDDGRQWRRVLTLDDGPGEYSYPAVIRTRDGLVHVTYTWRRERIAHVVLDPAVLR